MLSACALQGSNHPTMPTAATFSVWSKDGGNGCSSFGRTEEGCKGGIHSSEKNKEHDVAAITLSFCRSTKLANQCFQRTIKKLRFLPSAED